jgi:hypothetical protein
MASSLPEHLNMLEIATVYVDKRCEARGLVWVLTEHLDEVA